MEETDEAMLKSKIYHKNLFINIYMILNMIEDSQKTLKEILKYKIKCDEDYIFNVLVHKKEKEKIYENLILQKTIKIREYKNTPLIKCDYKIEVKDKIINEIYKFKYIILTIFIINKNYIKIYYFDLWRKKHKHWCFSFFSR